MFYFGLNTCLILGSDSFNFCSLVKNYFPTSCPTACFSLHHTPLNHSSKKVPNFKNICANPLRSYLLSEVTEERQAITHHLATK
jgi:hypothetical protein